jgi:hypothetical protein
MQNKWLPETDRRLRDLYLLGIDPARMATMLDRDEGAVRRRMSTLGLLTRKTARVGANLTRKSPRQSAMAGWR